MVLHISHPRDERSRRRSQDGGDVGDGDVELRERERETDGRHQRALLARRRLQSPGRRRSRRGGGGGEGGTAMNGPFYLLREAAGTTDLTGSSNLITHYNLEHTYNMFCGKQVKDKLSNFLPDLPGMIDLPGSKDNSSLRSLIEKPPICGNSFTLLTGTLLTGFRLHTGPHPEQYRLMHIQPPRKKSRHKHKHSRAQDPVPPETPSDSDAPPSLYAMPGEAIHLPHCTIYLRGHWSYDSYSLVSLFNITPHGPASLCTVCPTLV
ncbi:mediator of RNA polymerase II transcription subunit 19 [Amblyraja radiata]|uniref:mediator of RNA polymerase II transcription subunit 19 n=1 Tax=Amblyraja radiata TaxID=386614 RepID=UPI0014027DAB|nr:mediator of RNA polymerase II transcription subunit 19 [Amblyraja radiata]